MASSHQPTLPAPVARYAASGQSSVDGWLSRLDAEVIGLVAAAQAARGIRGSVGEIGVHHGRLFILVALGLQAGERAFAVDIFEDQRHNVDRSGEGDEARFRANMQRYGVAIDRVDIVRGSSLDVRWPDIARHVGQKARLFSIDGGHTARITANDLAIADAGLADDGVTVLDDYFNAEFPEVSQGMCQHRLIDGGNLVPFAIGDNKLLLARPGRGDAYREMLAATVQRRYFVRDTEMFGVPVVVFRTPRRLVHMVRQSEIARRIGRHPLGRTLKPIVRRILKE